MRQGEQNSKINPKLNTQHSNHDRRHLGQNPLTNQLKHHVCVVDHTLHGGTVKPSPYL